MIRLSLFLPGGGGRGGSKGGGEGGKGVGGYDNEQRVVKTVAVVQATRISRHEISLGRNPEYGTEH